MGHSSVFFSTAFVALAACGGAVAHSAAIGPGRDAGDGNPVDLDAGVVLSPDAAIPGVTRNGWTWSNGGPQGATLFGAWGSGPADVWFVGAAGTILHYDGSSFSAPDSGTGADLYGVWGSSATDVWAVGTDETGPDADILHWDGTSWSLATSLSNAELYSVSGCGASDVWASGTDGALVHWDGTQWTAAQSGTTNVLTDVWCGSANDAWAVGSAGAPLYDGTGIVLRYDGASWSNVVLPDGGPSFSAVWGTGPNDVWLAGGVGVDTEAPAPDPNGYLIHYDGAAWGTPFVTPAYDTPLAAVYGSASGDVSAVGSAGAVESWAGSAWSSHALPGTYYAIWESGPSDVWAAGFEGVMAHFDGNAWTQLVPPPAAWGQYEAAAVWSNSPTDAWVVGNGAIEVDLLHWNGQAWDPSTIEASSNAYMSFVGLWGTGPSDMWGVGSSFIGQGEARIDHYDGTTWSDVYDVAGSFEFGAVWGAAADDIWFAGASGALVHWDGATMTPVTTDGATDFAALGGTSGSDVWVAGEDSEGDATFLHYDGQSWSAPMTGGGQEPPTGLYAASPNDVWAVGEECAPAHWNGTSWSALPSREARTLFDVGSIWGSSSSDVWAVGLSTVVHFDGTTWTPVPITSEDVVGVSGSGSLDVWMVTERGKILHHP